jgi:hypothetical protein
MQAPDAFPGPPATAALAIRPILPEPAKAWHPGSFRGLTAAASLKR